MSLYSQPTFIGHSLWLVPHPSDVLCTLIEALAEEGKGSPAFPPHITLLPGMTMGEEEVMEVTRQLGSRLKPFDVVMGPVVTGKQYFKSVFSRIDRATHPVIVETHAQAVESFAAHLPEGGKGMNNDYDPHLSLAYGDLEDGVRETVKGLAEQAHVEGMKCRVAEIQVWSTEGLVKDWKQTGTVTMTGS